MVQSVLSKHLASIGRIGGKRFKPGKERMRELARLSWQSPKRLRKHANKVCSNKQKDLNEAASHETNEA